MPPRTLDDSEREYGTNPAIFEQGQTLDWNPAALPADGRIRYQLRRFGPRQSRQHVLLVHGASAGSRTFMVPDGGLLKYLLGPKRVKGAQEASWDVWTLDWRGSNLLSSFNKPPKRSMPWDEACEGSSDDPEEHFARYPPTLSEYARQFDLDRAVKHDLKPALAQIAHTLKAEGEESPELGIVGHCIGGAIVAMAIGAGVLDDLRDEIEVPSVVLSTLGLFYRVGMDGWLKGNDHMLERLLREQVCFPNDTHPVLTPWAATGRPEYRWPPTFERMYRLWKTTPLPHGCANEFCNRACFMFGMPYRAHDMQTLHDAPRGDGLWAQFGDMPLKLYMHCVRNLRMGYAVSYAPHGPDYMNPERFVGKKDGPRRAITLITGKENQVWHRDSIDRMYEWLVNHAGQAGRSAFQKHVLDGFGHQDLFWSSQARRVYELIDRALRFARTPSSSRRFPVST